MNFLYIEAFKVRAFVIISSFIIEVVVRNFHIHYDGTLQSHSLKVGCSWVTVASPGFVARREKAGNNVLGHSRWTSGPGAAAA